MKRELVIGAGAIALTLAVGAFFGIRAYREFSLLTDMLPLPPQPPPRTLPERQLGDAFVPVGPYETTNTEHPSPIRGLAISYDDRLAASGSQGTIKVTDLVVRRPLHTFTVDDDITTLAYTRDDQTLLAGGRKRLHALDATSGAERWSLPIAEITKVIVTKDGHTAYLANNAGEVLAIDLDQHRQRRRYFNYLPVVAFALSPDERTFATGTIDGSVAIVALDRSSFEVKSRTRLHARTIDDIAFSPDGKLLATVSDDRRTVISRLDDRDRPIVDAVFTSGNELWSASFSPDGLYLATACRDGHSDIIVVPQRWRAASTSNLAWSRVAFTHHGRHLVAAPERFLGTMLVPRRGLKTVLPTPGPTATDGPSDPVLGAPDLRAPDADERPTSAAAYLLNARLSLIMWRWRRPQLDRADYEDVQALLDKAAAAEPKTAEWWCTYAGVLANSGASARPNARKAIASAYALAPRDPCTALVEARLEYDDDEAETAIASLGALIRATNRPEVLVAAYRILAFSYAKLGDIDAAEAAFQKRLGLAPESKVAHEELADFWLAVNEPEKALAEGSVEANVPLGDVALWEQHRVDDALKLYEVAYAKRRLPSAQYGRAAIERERGQLDLARKDLEDVLTELTHSSTRDDRIRQARQALAEVLAKRN